MSYVQPVKIAVIGVGRVGGSFAYAALLKGLASEVVLIDKDTARAEATALDLQEAALFAHPVHVRAGTLQDITGAALTVICAGECPAPGRTSADVLPQNVALIKEIVPVIAEKNPQGIIVLATSPVDVLTYGAWKLSGLPRRQVIGVGTLVESARFRSLLGRQFRVDPAAVQAFVLGENGTSELPVWSAATIAGMAIAEICNAQRCELSAVDIKFREASGATSVSAPHHAVASALVKIAEAILHDEKSVFPVCSVLLGEYGMSRVALSVPTVLSREGVDRVLRLELSDKEVGELLFSGRKIEREIRRAEFVVGGSLTTIHTSVDKQVCEPGHA
jgi:L-lactate dehydrogenase